MSQQAVNVTLCKPFQKHTKQAGALKLGGKKVNFELLHPLLALYALQFSKKDCFLLHSEALNPIYCTHAMIN